MCTVYVVVLAELVRECELSGPEELAEPRESSARRLLPTCTASNSSGKRCPDSMMPTSPSSPSAIAIVSVRGPQRHHTSSAADASQAELGSASTAIFRAAVRPCSSSGAPAAAAKLAELVN